MKPIRSHAGAAVLAGTLFAAGACSGKAPEPVETIRVAVLQATGMLPYYVMRDQGFAAKERIRFEEVELASGAAILEGIVKGEVDLGLVGTTPAIAATADGTIPQKAVAIMGGAYADPDNPYSAVVTSKRITTWKQLAGKYIAVNRKTSIGAYGVLGRMRLEGVAAPKLVEVAFPNQGLAVRSGAVAAAVMFEPYITQSLLRGDGHVLGWVAGGPPMERTQQEMTVVATELLRARPDVVKRYIRAHLAAIRWIATNEDDARKVLARDLAISPEVAAKLRLPRWPADARNSVAQTTPVAALAAQIQGTEPIDPAILFDDRLLQSALRER